MSPVPNASRPEASPGRGRRADARRNAEAVLTAADRLVSRAGRVPAMSEVAAAAAVGVGTVYRHFPTQQALLGAALSRRFVAATAKVDAIVHEPGPAFERLRRALWIGAVEVATDPLTRLATRGGDGQAWEHAREARLDFDAAFAPLVRAARADGELRGDFLTQDVGMLMAAFCAGVEDADPERWKRLFAIAVDGLRTRPDPSAPGDPVTR